MIFLGGEEWELSNKIQGQVADYRTDRLEQDHC